MCIWGDKDVHCTVYVNIWWQPVVFAFQGKEVSANPGPGGCTFSGGGGCGWVSTTVVGGMELPKGRTWVYVQFVHTWARVV